MSKAARYRLSISAGIVTLLVIFNFIMCHPPATFVSAESKNMEWNTYRNVKYGFALEIPTSWKISESAFGIEIFSPDHHRYISAKALSEESTLLALPPDEYAIERAPQRHPYFNDSLLYLRAVVSDAGLQGYRIEPEVQRTFDWTTVHEPWVGIVSSQHVTTAYLPTQFLGDAFCSYVEIFSTGKPDMVFDRMIRSFRHIYPTLRQDELLSMHLIDTSQTPNPSVSYVGETRAFYFDFDKDGVAELLIAGMPRNMEDLKDRCFARVYRKIENRWNLVLEKRYSENSFHASDIKIVNIDNAYGVDVMLRFVEHGNPWGKNSSLIIFWDGQKFRGADFGPFGDARDLDGDGRDEIIVTTNNYFSQGAISSWWDVYVYENYDFVERNLKYPNFYKNEILPRYDEQITTVRGELALTKVPAFIKPAQQLLYRLQKYVVWTEDIAQGKAPDKGM